MKDSIWPNKPNYWNHEVAGAAGAVVKLLFYIFNDLVLLCTESLCEKLANL